MKKKFLAFLFATLIAPVAFIFSACGSSGSLNSEYLAFETMSKNVINSYDVDYGVSDVSGASLEKSTITDITSLINNDEYKIEMTERVGSIMKAMFQASFISPLACGKVLTENYKYTHFYGVVVKLQLSETDYGYYVVKQVSENNYALFATTEFGDGSNRYDYTSMELYYKSQNDFHFTYYSDGLSKDGTPYFSFAYGNSNQEFTYLSIRQNFNQAICYDGTKAYETMNTQVTSQVHAMVYNNQIKSGIKNGCDALLSNADQEVDVEQFNQTVQKYLNEMGSTNVSGSVFKIEDGILIGFNPNENGKYEYGKSTLEIPKAVNAISVSIAYPNDVTKVVIPNTVKKWVVHKSEFNEDSKEYKDFEEIENSGKEYSAGLMYAEISEDCRFSINPYKLQKLNNTYVNKVSYASDSPLVKTLNGNGYYKAKNSYMPYEITNIDAFCIDNNLGENAEFIIDVARDFAVYEYENQFKEILKQKHLNNEYTVQYFIDNYNFNNCSFVFDYENCTGDEYSGSYFKTFDMMYELFSKCKNPITINRITIKNLRANPNRADDYAIISIGEYMNADGNYIKEIKEINFQDIDSGAKFVLKGIEDDSWDLTKTTTIGNLNLSSNLASLIIIGNNYVTTQSELVLPEFLNEFYFVAQAEGDFEITVNKIEWKEYYVSEDDENFDISRATAYPYTTGDHILTINSRYDRFFENKLLESLKDLENFDPDSIDTTEWVVNFEKDESTYGYTYYTSKSILENYIKSNNPNIVLNVKKVSPLTVKYNLQESSLTNHEFVLNYDASTLQYTFEMTQSLDLNCVQVDLSEYLSFVFPWNQIRVDKGDDVIISTNYIVPIESGENTFVVTAVNAYGDSESIVVKFVKEVGLTLFVNLNINQDEELNLNIYKDQEITLNGTKLSDLIKIENGKKVLVITYTQNSKVELGEIRDAINYIRDLYYLDTICTDSTLEQSAEDFIMQDNTSLFVKWQDREFEWSYDQNIKYNDYSYTLPDLPNTITASQGTIDLSAYIPTREHYEFIGW